jgi:hypothetical protein
MITTSGGMEMKSAQSLKETAFYDVGDFGDARLKKRRCSVPAHGIAANRVFAATGGKPGAGSSIWPLACE